MNPTRCCKWQFLIRCARINRGRAFNFSHNKSSRLSFYCIALVFFHFTAEEEEKFLMDAYISMRKLFFLDTWNTMPFLCTHACVYFKRMVGFAAETEHCFRFSFGLMLDFILQV